MYEIFISIELEFNDWKHRGKVISPAKYVQHLVYNTNKELKNYILF